MSNTTPHDPQEPNKETQMSYDPNYPTPNPYYNAPIGQQQVNPEKNGFGIAGIICAIAGLLFSIIPFTGFIAFILGMTAVVLGLSGWSRVRKNKATNKKVSIAAVIVGVIAMAIGIWGMVIVFGAVDEFDKDMDCLSNAETSQQIDACN
jgi:hypothetical protein